MGTDENVQSVVTKLGVKNTKTRILIRLNEAWSIAWNLKAFIR